MRKLWEEKTEYTIFDPEKHNCLYSCYSPYEFLPYIRLYETLNNKELLFLIKFAKEHRWQALDLTHCGIKTLPDELWELSDLKLLFIGNLSYYIVNYDHIPFDEYPKDNTFSIIPQKIEQLKNLQVLSLAYKVNTKFENDKTLDLPNLIYLDINYCGYPQIPKPLLIPSLEGIMYDCPSPTLSDDFLLLENLKEIIINISAITKLPEGFGNSNKLEKLYLLNSKISSLPQSLGNAENLNYIEISGTPLAEKIPPEILKQSAKEIVRYVLDLQSNSSKTYFNEAKMLIVGQGSVGKTSVFERILHNTYTTEKSTEGIDISSWGFVTQDQEYKLNVWDFGGQEIYHATHQFFLTKRSVYLLVWDALAEEEYGRLDYWLKTIQSFAADSPIILIVNKCDKNLGRYNKIDVEYYKEKFPQIKNVFYVSCRDNIGIHELKECIKDISINLPLMKTPWFDSWLAVRNELEGLAKTENHIPYNEYFTICKKNGVDNEEEALSLIKYLHDLGIVLYYHDDFLLKHLVILSSEWGTDAVYKIVDEQERQLKDRNGILYTDDLEKIWSDRERYPDEYYPHLLNLMEKFQLAFKIDDRTYLFAELLENKQIVLDWDFPRENTLAVRYEYDFLPAGVMTRFIVSIHRDIATIDGTKQCWKKGVYLRHESAYALVRLFDGISEKYVSIQVSGEKRRDKVDLLCIIKSKLDEINSVFSKIEITKRIPCNCSKDCPYLFDYDYLIKAESKGRKTVICEKSCEDVSISNLLDGVKPSMEKTNGNYNPIEIKPIINVNPTITSSSQSTSNATSSASNSVSVTVEIKDNIYNMSGDLNSLKSFIGDKSEEANQELQMAEKALNDLENCETDVEIKKSGALGRLKTFIEDCNDPKTTVGKIVNGTKVAGRFLKGLAEKYNSVAKWVGFPQVPFV